MIRSNNGGLERIFRVMGKAAKWLKSLFTGKKGKTKCTNNQNSTTPISIPPTNPKEKRRWSFRRSSATSTPARESISIEQVAATPPPARESNSIEQVAAIPSPTEVALPAAVEEAGAKIIQSMFRSYLARKALKALKGIVKLQALVRGHLVRRQATVTLKCMQALITAQARARAQRIRMAEDSTPASRRQSPHRRSTTPDHRFRHESNEIDSGLKENIKVAEMVEHGFSNHCSSNNGYTKQDNYQLSPTPSALIDISPKVCSDHFEENLFNIAQSSPQCDVESESYEYPLCPSYMANTKSSSAKVRSQSAPKTRPDSIERQPSGRRRATTEGRNHIPKAMKMKRSSSHVGATAENYKYPWSIKLDRSSASLKDSECGSTSTVLTNTNYYCRSNFGYEYDASMK